MSAQKTNGKNFNFARFYDKYGVFAVFAIIFIISCFLSPKFIKMTNLLNIMRQISMFGILAVGMTFVIVSGGIDLSVGAVIALVCVVTAQAVNHIGIIPAILIAVVIGLCAGLINGIGVTYGRLQPFIMTLGTTSMISGAAYIYSKGLPVSIKGPFSKIGNTLLFGKVPLPAIYLVVIMLIAHFVMTSTPFGRFVYSIGCNKEATRLSGVNVNRQIIKVYMISGVLAALTGIIFASQMASGAPTAGEGYEMKAITAAVVGGTSMSGGKGNMLGTFMGAVIIGILSNIMNLTGVSSYWQTFLTGLILVIAVLIRRD